MRKSTDIRLQKLMDAQAEYSFQCECGRKEIIPVWTDKKICTWCGKTIYKTQKAEFEDKLKIAMVKEKRNQNYGRVKRAC